MYDLLARTVARMVCGAAEAIGIHQALLAGGVASSPLFREMVPERVMKRNREVRIYFGKPEYSGDNAVGAALIGAAAWRKTQA